MGPKTIDFVGDNLTYKSNPGPGAYESIEMEPKSGKILVSKFGGTQFGMMNKTARFPN